MIKRVSIPISACYKRIRFLDSCLASLIKNSQIMHDIVVISEDFRLHEMVSYMAKWEQYSNIRFVEGIKKYVHKYGNDYNPIYQFLNDGVKISEEDWVIIPTGDDSYFCPDWETLLEHVELDLKESYNWTPRYVKVQACGDWDTSERQYAQQSPQEEREHYAGFNIGVNKHEWRIYLSKPYVLESDLLCMVRPGQSDEIFDEDMNLRHRVGWAHSVCHKDAFCKAGAFDDDPPGGGHDIDFCTKLSKIGVIKKRGVFSSLVVNCWIPIIIGR